MEIKPDIVRLMKRDALGFGLMAVIIILSFVILQILVVNLDDEASAEDFVKYVWPWVIGFVTLLWMIWPWIAYLWYMNLRYVIHEERLIIFKGILNKKEVSVPYRAVTDFTLRRGYFERKLGLGALLVQTAGQSADGTGYEAKLVGLTNYEGLHGELRARLDRARPGGLELGLQDSNTLDDDTLKAILSELRSLRQYLERKT